MVVKTGESPWKSREIGSPRAFCVFQGHFSLFITIAIYFRRFGRRNGRRNEIFIGGKHDIAGVSCRIFAETVCPNSFGRSIEEDDGFGPDSGLFQLKE